MNTVAIFCFTYTPSGWNSQLKVTASLIAETKSTLSIVLQLTDLGVEVIGIVDSNTKTLFSQNSNESIVTQILCLLLRIHPNKCEYQISRRIH